MWTRVAGGAASSLFAAAIAFLIAALSSTGGLADGMWLGFALSLLGAVVSGILWLFLSRSDGGGGRPLLRHSPVGGGGGSSAVAGHDATALTINVHGEAETINIYIVQELSEFIEEAKDLVRRALDPGEDDDEAIVERIYDWHRRIRNFFEARLNMGLYSYMENHEGLTQLSSRTRASWSQGRIQWLHHMRFDLQRLSEMMLMLQRRT